MFHINSSVELLTALAIGAIAFQMTPIETDTPVKASFKNKLNTVFAIALFVVSLYSIFVK